MGLRVGGMKRDEGMCLRVGTLSSRWGETYEYTPVVGSVDGACWARPK